MSEKEVEDQEAEGGEQNEKKGKSALTKKLIKVMTVIAYASGVSSAGVLLSLYYIIFWNPQIKGVRPPDYLRSVEMEDYPQVRVASSPEALRGDEPIAAPQVMTKEIMEDLFNNFTGEEIAAASGMREGQPTPNVLPVINDGYEAAHTAHHTPTQPLPPYHSESMQGAGTGTSMSHSSHHQPHRTNSRDHQHYEQQQQRHYQLQHHHQQQQQALAALA